MARKKLAFINYSAEHGSVRRRQSNGPEYNDYKIGYQSFVMYNPSEELLNKSAAEESKEYRYEAIELNGKWRLRNINTNELFPNLIYESEEECNMIVALINRSKEQN